LSRASRDKALYSEKDKEARSGETEQFSAFVSVYLHIYNIDDRQARRENKAIVQRPVLCKQYLYIHRYRLWKSEKRTHASSCYTNTNQPKMKPNTESAAGAIGAQSSASVPDLKPGLPLELGRLPEPVDEPVPDVVDVALGMSDDGTAEMGDGDWPP